MTTELCGSCFLPVVPFLDPSASGDKGSSLVGWCPPLASACPRTPWVFAQSPLQQLLAETNSSLEALRPFFFSVFPRLGQLVLPWCDALLWVSSHGLSSCCDRKPEAGRQQDTSPGWPGKSCQKSCTWLPGHKVFCPYLQGPPITWYQTKSSSGELPWQTPPLSPPPGAGRTRGLLLGAVFFAPVLAAQNNLKDLLQHSPLLPQPSLPSTCI